MPNTRSCRLLVVLLACFATYAAQPKEIQGQDAQGRDYWVYLPDQIDPETTYTLVVGVHGYRGNGKGAGGYARWVGERDVIVLGPSFDSNGYQYLQKGSDQQTLELVAMLRKDYRLHEKIFIGGFSGGAQYAHRFAMKYPELVAGCAAHSGGTWGTGDYPPNEPTYINPAARGVLFVVSCGENDTKKSFGEAPMGRLDWAKKYAGMLEAGGFVFDAQWWPGVGHRQSPGAKQQSVDCFVASTQRLPAYESERAVIAKAIRARDASSAWSIVRARLAHSDRENDGILGKVHKLYIDSLEQDIARIDRLAQREVRNATQKQDIAAQRGALAQLRETYAGLSETTGAIEAALAGLEGVRRQPG